MPEDQLPGSLQNRLLVAQGLYATTLADTKSAQGGQPSYGTVSEVRAWLILKH